MDIPENPSQEWTSGFLAGADMAKSDALLQIKLMAMERPDWAEALLWAHGQLEAGPTEADLPKP